MDKESDSATHQEWSVHAQLTLSHGDSQKTQFSKSTHESDGGVKMQYSWEPGIDSIWETSGTGPHRPSYGFQRGNLLFTTSPPQCGINRISEIAGYGKTFPRTANVSQESKYRNLSKSPVTMSDTTESSVGHAVGPLLDSGYASEKFNTLPARRPVQQYERRCRSTCSIVLSCEVPYERTLSSETHRRKSTDVCPHCNLITKDDSWCCNLCTKFHNFAPTVSGHTFTTQFSTHVLNDEQKDIKDAASQTQTEQVEADTMRNQKDEDFTRPAIVLSECEDAFDKPKVKNEKKKLCRSPARLRGKSPYLSEKVNNRSNSEVKKQPRTVHIDVYCTGSDEADGSGSSSEDETPRTVYENENMRVIHRRAKRNELPARRQAVPSYHPSQQKERVQKSDEEDATTCYPSAESSRTTLLESFGAFPTESCSNLSQCGTCLNASTSWEDTECSSYLRRGIGLTGGSSASNSLCMTSDSFEYADSIDKQRIKALEDKLSGNGDNTEEKEISIRKKIFNRYLESHSNSFPIWKESSSRESLDSDDSCSTTSGSEILWTFTHFPPDVEKAETNNPGTRPTEKDSAKSIDSGSLSDSSPSTVCRLRKEPMKQSSPLLEKLENTSQSPFTSSYMGRTECFEKARKFGEIVNSFRKPGHHVGPAKNPDCTCNSCLWYYQENQCRGRTRSVSDVPVHRNRSFDRDRSAQPEISSERKKTSTDDDLP